MTLKLSPSHMILSIGVIRISRLQNLIMFLKICNVLPLFSGLMEIKKSDTSEYANGYKTRNSKLESIILTCYCFMNKVVFLYTWRIFPQQQWMTLNFLKRKN